MKANKLLLSLLIAIPFLASTTVNATTISENLSNIVHIACGDYIEDEPVTYGYGSGVLFDNSTVLTNAHVSNFVDESNELIPYDWCIGGIAHNAFEAPEYSFGLSYTDYYGYNDYLDYEFLSAYDLETGEEWAFESSATYGNPDSLIHGDSLTLIGYPGTGGETITTTQGQVAGFVGTNWIKTDAVAEFGNSGGGAFDLSGDVIGITTAVISGDLNSFTYIQNLNTILEDAFGTEFITRDLSTIYTSENETCFSYGACFQFGESGDLELDSTVDVKDSNSKGSATISENPAPYDESKHDKSLISRLAGNILLQVEASGEAWYLHPAELKRYYMKDGNVAYSMMRNFGLGITDLNLARLSEVADPSEMLNATSVCSTDSFARGLRGKILLQVEQRGEAFYVHPDTCRMIYMKDGAAAYDIMRFLSLGITNADLTKIPTSVLN